MRSALLVAVAAAAALACQARAQTEFPVDSFADGNLKITFIGHASLMLQSGSLTIHVDPVSRYASYERMPKADLVLITHDHSDHLDPAAVQAVRKADTEIVANRNAAARLAGSRVLANGESATIKGVEIRAVAAYNTSPLKLAFHPKGRDNGYVLTIAGKRVYIAGDTEDIPEMADLAGIDIAFLPMNLPYTMSPAQVATAARRFAPKILYPYHTGETDLQELVRLLAGSGIEVRLRPLK